MKNCQKFHTISLQKILSQNITFYYIIKVAYNPKIQIETLGLILNRKLQFANPRIHYNYVPFLFLCINVTRLGGHESQRQWKTGTREGSVEAVVLVVARNPRSHGIV